MASNIRADDDAGGQIVCACRATRPQSGRRGDQPNETTTHTVTEYGATETDARAAQPRAATIRIFACHGLGHEIVKEPFATPDGGDTASRSARRAACDGKPEVLKTRCLRPDFAHQAPGRVTDFHRTTIYITGARPARKAEPLAERR